MTVENRCGECGKTVAASDRFCAYCGANTTGARGEATSSAAMSSARKSPWDAILDRLQRAVAPKYRVKRVLGYGGMAGVYLAEEPKLGRRVAIKVMSPALMVDPKLVDRFEQEARTIAQLNHPHIVTIYDVDERDDLHYFTMTYVAGRAMSQVMDGGKPLPFAVVSTWLSQIAAALAYAHRAGVVHRDIKPGNILLDTEGNALVTDFGIAKVTDEPSLTRTGMLIGTPAYMSPEQCAGTKITGASDQYSLGAVAYQMLTGQPPFGGQTVSMLHAHLTVKPRPVRELRTDCPQNLASIVERMLEKKVEERWPTMFDVVDVLGAAPPGFGSPVRELMRELAAQVYEVVLEDAPETVTAGELHTLTAAVRDETGRTLRTRRVEWQTADPDIAIVEEDGTLRALRPGKVRLEARCEGATREIELTVSPGKAERLEVRAPDQVEAGDSRSLEAIVQGRTEPADRPVVWSSSDPTIARVSPSGVVEGLAPGMVTVTATTGELSATAILTVTGPGTTPIPVVPGITEWVAPPPKHADAPTGAVEPPPHVPPPPARAPDPAAGSGRGRRRRAMIGGALVLVAAVVTTTVLMTGGGGTDDTGTDTVSDESLLPPVMTPPADAGLTTTDPTTNDTTAAQPAQTPRVVVGDTATAGGRQPAPDAGRAAARPATNAGGRATSPVVNPPPPPPPPPPPAAPATGTVRIGGRLPAGAQTTATSADGQSRSLQAGANAMPPGDYNVEVRATGYVTARTVLRVRPGETETWVPDLRAVQQETPPPPPPPPAPPSTPVGGAEAEAAVRGAINAFAAAFAQRQSSIVALFPPSERDNWSRLFEAGRSVTDMQASVTRYGTPDFTPTTATVEFSLRYSFKQQGTAVPPQEPRYAASLEKPATGGWRIVSLRRVN